MATKQQAIYRTDVLSHSMNEKKEQKVRDLLSAWRKACVLQSREQWRLFFQRGNTNKRHDVSRTGYDVLGTSYGQMVRWHVVGQLDSWISNRANDFKRIVVASSLSSETKHQLYLINRLHGWYNPEPVLMRDGAPVAGEVRALARKIFKNLLSTHRKPSLKHAHMMIDQRCVSISESNSTKFKIWLRLSTLEKGKRINIPLKTYPLFESRQGKRAASVSVFERNGDIVFGLMTDMSFSFSQSRLSYSPYKKAIALDLGLVNLFVTNEGDLIGRNWLGKLKHYDGLIVELASYRQKHGMKVRSPKYSKIVDCIRGYIKTGVRRALNRVVNVHRPAEIVVERLNFNNPNLSRRLNRIISNFGKNEVSKKLEDLSERYGIVVTEVNAAYSSQTDAVCGYVDKRNRPSQGAFTCKWCGTRRHADVNAARNLMLRRSDASIGDIRQRKQDILVELVKRFNERTTGTSVSAADPRKTNKYFGGRV